MNSKKLIAEQMDKINELCRQPLANKGKGIDEVAKRQRRRKVTVLRQSCERALWFTDSFNVDIISLLVKRRTKNETLSIDVSTPSSSTCSPIPSPSPGMIHKVLYLLDRFAISDEFYHELSMIDTALPRSYKVKKARQRLNEQVELIRLPKPYFGCYRSFLPSLQEAEVSLHDYVKKLN